MPNQIQDFLQWAERDRLRSPATIKRYQTVLAQIPDPLNATVEDVEAWWAGRYDKSAATRQNELACLRTFYKWATRFDHRVDDPRADSMRRRSTTHSPAPSAGATLNGR